MKFKLNNLFSKKVEQLKQYIDEADNIVFFGGAGVSTESGIPDFRSKNGIYNTRGVDFSQYEPEYLMSSYCLLEKPEVFYAFYRQKLDCRNAQPNITHYKLAELEKNHNLVVVTQNVDGLHQKAGSKNVLEIHGTAQSCFCRRCGREYPASYIFDCKDPIPRCTKCINEENEYCTHEMALIRPRISLFGEFLPSSFSTAMKKVNKADLLIIGGTSLKVYPAAGVVDEFKNKANITLYGIKKHKRLVIINNESTKYDDQADLVFHNPLGKVFSKL